MRQYVRVVFRLLAWTFCLTATTAHGFALRPYASLGLMQQPASQYYHLVRGGSVEVSVYKSWSFRGTYLERPPFSNAGYIDQDIFVYGQTGSEFFKKDLFGVFGYVGAGRCWGYIKEDDGNYSGQSVHRSDYSIAAFVLTMESSITTKYLSVRFGHSLLTGRAASDSRSSNVAWPFTVFYLSLSAPIFSDNYL